MQDGMEAEPEPKEEKEEEADDVEEDDHELDHSSDTTMIEGKSERTGKLSRKSDEVTSALRGGPGEGGVESYSGLGQDASSEDASDGKFVRWSSSTEIGDFIRDAARGTEFSVSSTVLIYIKG